MRQILLSEARGKDRGALETLQTNLRCVDTFVMFAMVLQAIRSAKQVNIDHIRACSSSDLFFLRS